MRIGLMLAVLISASCTVKDAPGDAFGVWQVNQDRSTGPYSDILAVRFEGRRNGEVFTLDTIDQRGRSATSSTILYFDGKARDFQDSACSGTQSSRRVDTDTVEILRNCSNGRRVRLVRQFTGKPRELVLEITEQGPDGLHQERRLVLKKLAGASGKPQAKFVAAQAVVVTGTGDPTVDIRAVQAPVDQGGQVFLKGRFSFRNNTFVTNDLTGFRSSLGDVYVDASVTNTVVVGPVAKVEDHGVAPVVVPMAGVR